MSEGARHGEMLTRLAEFARPAIFSVLFAVLIVGSGLAAFSYVTARTDDSSLLREIELAFDEGHLVPVNRLLNNRQIGAFQGNDCLILGMAANAAGSTLERAVSPFGRPRLVGPDSAVVLPDDTDSVCGRLQDIVSGNEEDYGYTPYHRYIHGGRALAEMAVPIVGVQGLRDLLLAANRLVLLAAFLISFTRLASPGKRTEDRAVHAGFALLSLLLLVLSGVDHLGMSLSMGPADLAVHLMFLLLVIGDPLRLSRPIYFAIVSCGAALVIYFEFLTGQLPLAVALLVLLPAIAMRSNQDIDEARGRVVFGVTSFVTVCITLMLGKFWLTSMVFGSEIWDDVGDTLQRRTSLEDFSLFDVFARLAYRMHHAAFGYVTLGLLYLGVGTLLFIRCGWIDYQAGTGPRYWRRFRAIGFIGAAGAILLWYLIFSSHAAIHSWFMFRPVALFAAMGCTYAILIRMTSPGGAEMRNRFDRLAKNR